MDDRRRFWLGMWVFRDSAPVRVKTRASCFAMATACDVECDGSLDHLLTRAEIGRAIVWC